MLRQLGKVAYLRHRAILVAFLILVGTLLALALSYPSSLPTDFAVKDLPSTKTRAQMDERFPPGPTAQGPTYRSGSIVVRTDTDMRTDQQQIQDLINAIAATGLTKPGETISPPWEAATELRTRMYTEKRKLGIPDSVIEGDFRTVSPLSSDGRTGIIEVQVSSDASSGTRAELTKLLDQHNSDTMEVSYYGDAFRSNSHFLSAAELLGVLVAFLILTAALGSAITAGLSLVSAIAGVASGLSLVFMGARFLDGSNFLTPFLAIMLGLAVGIDYALFIAYRYRSELRDRQAATAAERAEVMGIVLEKAGRPVIFAGLTVTIGLCGLLVFDIPFLSAMAIAAGATVITIVVFTLTLLPALLATIRIKPATVHTHQLSGRWIDNVQRRPWLHLAVVSLILVVCAIPAPRMNIAMPTDGSAALGSPTRTAADTLKQGFGEGRNAHMVALVDLASVPENERKTEALKIAQQITRVEGVKNAQPTRGTDSLDTLELLITTEYAANSPEAAETLDRLRATSDSYHQSSHASFGVTGPTPVFVDLTNRLADTLVPYILIVLLLASLALVAVFRSVMIPLLATAGFLLTIAATFGITVATFQLDPLGLNPDPQPLISFLPVILIGLTFGLAMDYQVFLVSRMRELRMAGADTATAIREGFRSNARVVSSAATIMICVFASFSFAQEPFVRTMAFALAVAVLIDAFLIRMTLIPAAMHLLGDRCWWNPIRSGDSTTREQQ